ncbi:MAG TPA: DUF6777 domain-containing protein [Solirubrobacteraceae bacterium]
MRAGRYVTALIIAVVAAIGGAVGWLIGGGGKAAEAAPRVRFIPAGEIGASPFTPATDIRGAVTIRGSGPFGGTGSNFVCDRELLIKFLVAKPDRMRAWARVQAIPPTVASVTRYIRALRPATLLTPTRVTNYFYANGRAVPFQAVLGAGTAVLVDSQGAIRARCRCGNPLQDPIVTPSERCDGCPAGFQVPQSWRLSASYYVIHPAPPPVKGQRGQPGGLKDVTVEVIRVLSGGYVLKEVRTDANGKTQVRTVTVPKPANTTVTVARTTTKRGGTVTVSRNGTVFVPRTLLRTVTRVLHGPTVTKTVTVFTGQG